MAINKNHEFEDLNGVKCAIVEKNASQARVDFLKSLLEFNHYIVIVVPSPPPKVAPVKPPAPAPAEVTAGKEAEAPPPAPPPPPPPPETFTIGVTDVMFNPTNAIFGRLLRTPTGHFVTLAYWEQKESESHDEIPYYENKFS
ncbi:MAG TPA: hypothetical protein VE978_26490 [Chitinophagales bacterium]|nr:hypothetical protein [Chitinophagales bacterium]